VPTLSPALLLAIVFVLIGAQITRIVAPDRGSYLWALLLAAGGVVAGEAIALGMHSSGLSLGSLHPLPEAVGVLLFESVGALLVRPKGGSGPA